MTAPASDSGDPLDPPPIAYKVYVWKIALGLLVTVVAWVVGLVFPPGESQAIAPSLVGLGFLAFLLYRYIAARQRRLQLVEAVLSGDGSSNALGRDRALASLKAFARLSTSLVAVLAFALAGSLTLLAYGHIYRAFYARAPQAVPIDSLSYFEVGTHAALLLEAPFLEAATVFLRDEAKGAGKAAQIFVVESKPFDRPAASFKIALTFNPGRYKVSGYAFLKRGEGRQPVFEPLRTDYSSDGKVSMRIESCQGGDRFMFIGRMTSEGKAEFLPIDSQVKLVIDG